MKNGYLKVAVYTMDESTPVKDANVFILTNDTLHTTDEFGTTGSIVLGTYPKENSLEKGSKDISYKYDLKITAEGFSDYYINNIEIFENVTTEQKIFLEPAEENKIKSIFIDPPVLNGNYSSKYKEEENNASTYVLKDVLIPEYVIVHDGYPDDYKASKYYVPFADYIKNVAASEIYPTWGVEALKANILAIISYTLNRVYTEWYPSKGYAFTITSVTAYDQKYTVNKATFDTINVVVDEMLPQYIKRTNKNEPMFAQYCDGDVTKNEDWLYQWGSSDLASRGYTYYNILRYYYGDSIEFKEAKYAVGLPTSFPGYNLSLGACGEAVKKMQEYINIIRGNYPGLIKINNPNGEFDENTRESVVFFQSTFNLSVTGVVDYATWYKISYLYLAVMRMIYGVYDR